MWKKSLVPLTLLFTLKVELQSRWNHRLILSERPNYHRNFVFPRSPALRPLDGPRLRTTSTKRTPLLTPTVGGDHDPPSYTQEVTTPTMDRSSPLSRSGQLVLSNGTGREGPGHCSPDLKKKMARHIGKMEDHDRVAPRQRLTKRSVGSVGSAASGSHAGSAEQPCSYLWRSCF